MGEWKPIGAPKADPDTPPKDPDALPVVTAHPDDPDITKPDVPPGAWKPLHEAVKGKSSKTVEGDKNWPKGASGSAKAQMAGQLHGISQVAGGPVDLVNAALSPVGLSSDEPFLGSKSIRRMMDYPGAAAGKISDLLFGEGAGSRYGFYGHATYNDINEVPEEYRAQARAGEVMGSTYASVLPIAGISKLAQPAERLATAAKPTGSALKNLGRDTLAQAAKPGFAGKTMAAAAPAAAGAWGAETAFPGSPIAQTVGQLGGGLFGAGLSAGTGKVAGAVGKATEPFRMQTDEGRRTIVGRKVGAQLEKENESPDAIIRRLKEDPVVPGARPVERAGSPTLFGIEKELASKDPDLANSIARQNAYFESSVTRAVNESFVPGDRGALTRAAQSFQAHLDSLVSNAETAAQQAASRISPIEPAEREMQNVQARAILENSLQTARQTERTLWQQVPRTTQVQATHAVRAFDEIRGEMLPDATLPNLIHRTMLRLAAAPNTDLGMLQNLRSEVLEQARVARGMGEVNTSRRLEQIGRGLLRDMDTAGGEQAALARAYSFELNQRFTRSFAGDVLGLKETGAASVRPQSTMERAVTGRPQEVAAKLEEMQRAATPIPPQIDPETGRIIPPAQLSPEMRSLQESFLQNLSSRFTDPATGRVKPQQAASFIRDFGPVLDRFPYYRQHLEDALSAQIASEHVGGQLQDMQRDAFAKVIEAGEIPMHAVASTLGSKTPARSFADLATLARNGGAEAVGGLRATILDFVMDASINRSSGTVSYAAAHQSMTSPIYPNGPSLLGLMQNNGVITERQGADIVARLNAGMMHEEASKMALEVPPIGDQADFVAKSASRIIGAKLSSWLGLTKGGAGPSLQVASVAASAAERYMTRMPIAKARQILADAMAAEDPEQLIDILSRAEPVGGRAQPGNISYLIPLLRTMLPQDQSKVEWMSDKKRGKREKHSMNGSQDITNILSDASPDPVLPGQQYAQNTARPKTNGFSWGEVFENRNKRLPEYTLPRVSNKAGSDGSSVIEDFSPKQKTMDAKGASETEEAYDRKLDEWAKKTKVGDKLLLYDEDGHQFWHIRDDNFEGGWSIWFPPEEMSMTQGRQTA